MKNMRISFTNNLCIDIMYLYIITIFEMEEIYEKTYRFCIALAIAILKK